MRKCAVNAALMSGFEPEKNALARRLDTAGDNARYDESCKQILSSIPILARILKFCVSEFAI